MEFATLSEYIAILSALKNEGSLKLAELTSLRIIKPVVLETALAFLARQDLIKELPEGGESARYALTARSFKILSFFGLSRPVKPRAA